MYLITDHLAALKPDRPGSENVTMTLQNYIDRYAGMTDGMQLTRSSKNYIAGTNNNIKLYRLLYNIFPVTISLLTFTYTSCCFAILLRKKIDGLDHIDSILYFFRSTISVHSFVFFSVAVDHMFGKITVVLSWAP